MTDVRFVGEGLFSVCWSWIRPSHVASKHNSKFNILYNLSQFLASKSCSISYPALLLLPPPAASPAADCPFWLHPAAVLSGESPPSAKLHFAGEAGSTGAPQTFLAAHRLLLLAAAGPGNADVEPPVESSNLGTLRDKSKMTYTEVNILMKMLWRHKRCIREALTMSEKRAGLENKNMIVDWEIDRWMFRGVSVIASV